MGLFGFGGKTVSSKARWQVQYSLTCDYDTCRLQNKTM